MFEAGIPIDKVGGVSIGAFMGALWAIHRDIEEMTVKSRKWFYNMTRYSGLLDLTYPMTSLFTGGYFNWTLTETFDRGNFTHFVNFKGVYEEYTWGIGHWAEPSRLLP